MSLRQPSRLFAALCLSLGLVRRRVVVLSLTCLHVFGCLFIRIALLQFFTLVGCLDFAGDLAGLYELACLYLRAALA